MEKGKSAACCEAAGNHPGEFGEFNQIHSENFSVRGTGSFVNLKIMT